MRHGKKRRLLPLLLLCLAMLLPRALLVPTASALSLPVTVSRVRQLRAGAAVAGHHLPPVQQLLLPVAFLILLLHIVAGTRLSKLIWFPCTFSADRSPSNGSQSVTPRKSLACDFLYDTAQYTLFVV